MPFFDFLCNCGHMHEEFTSAKVVSLTCPSCGAAAYRQLSMDVGMAQHSVEPQGPGPQATGSSLDFNPDHAIGEDARKKWEVVEQRDAYKRGILAENPGKELADLSRQHDGSYTVLTQESRAVAEEVREINNQAMHRQRVDKQGAET